MKRDKLSILVFCMYIYPPHVAGAEIHAYYVSNELVEFGHYVRVIAIGPAKQTSDPQVRILFKQSLIQVRRGFLGNFSYVFKVFLLGYRLRNRIDVVQVHIATTAMIPAFIISKIANKPYVVTCHGSDIRILRKNAFVKLLQRIPLLGASKVFCVSKEIRNLLINEYKIPSQNINLVTNGFDKKLVNRFSAVESSDVSDENPSLVFVGSLRKVKDPLALIEVFKIVSERAKNVRLQIVGDGPLKQTVEKMIQTYGLQGKVILHGAVSHQRALEILASSEIYVLTSVEEGLPTSLIEAMALGKPIVATCVGGVPEIVIDGVNGLLVPPGALEKMAQSIEQLLENPAFAKKLGKAAAESVQDFSWENIAQKYLCTYREVSEQKAVRI